MLLQGRTLLLVVKIKSGSTRNRNIAKIKVNKSGSLPITLILFAMRKEKHTTSKEAKESLLENSTSLSSLAPEFTILDDLDVQDLLKISKRKLAQMRADREIEYHPTGKAKLGSKKLREAVNNKGKGKRAGKIYYTLAGVLNYVKSTTVLPVFNQRNI